MNDCSQIKLNFLNFLKNLHIMFLHFIFMSQTLTLIYLNNN